MSASGADRLFITTDAIGGVWSYSVALAQGAALSGVQCVLAVLGPASSTTQRAVVTEIAGCGLINTGLPLDWTVADHGELDAIAAALIEKAVESGCNTAHLHAPALAAGRWPMPVVAVVHSCMATWWLAVHGGAPPASIAWHHAATTEGLAASDEIIAPSKAFAAALQRVYQPTRPMQVIHNGLPETLIRAFDRERAVLGAGRLWDAGKNMGVLDAAAAMLDLPVYVAGPTHAPDGSRAEFAHLRSVGYLKPAALRKRMASAAMFAAPSLYEPFGLAVLEAAQQGTALLLSDIPTFRELWSDAAIFVQADRPAAWAEAIEGLADDHDRLAELGKLAALRSRRYTQDAMASATMAVHHGLGQHALCAA